MKLLTSCFYSLYERATRSNLMKIKSQSSREYRGERLQALTVRQARFIDAIGARILPTTDTPGAVEAGAVFYIDRALAGPYPHLLSRYARGLRALDAHAKRQFGAAFEKLNDEQRDTVLRDLESGQVTGLRDGQ